uniref:hypothetical protein n=1 Tax=uncultured Sphingomonas sp. TaxID=158754 RepID=UPI0035CBB801
MKTALRLTWIWIALVFAYMLWESKHAVGASAFLTDLQYTWIGFYKPTVSFLMLVLVFATPVAIAFLLPGRRRRANAIPFSAERGVAIHAARRKLRIFVVVSSVAAICAATCLVVWLTLPRPGGVPAAIVADERLGAELPRGSVYLDHPRVAGPVMRYNQRILWTNHYTHYVPIVTTTDTRRALLFVEVGGDVPKGTAFAVAPRYDGIIVQGGMPPSVADLYAKIGVLAPGPQYVLFSTPTDLARPWLIAVLQFAIAGFITLPFILLQARRLRKLERPDDGTVQQQDAPVAEPAPLAAA